MEIRNRIDLAKYFGRLGFTRGAEVGACFGRFSEILCQNIPGLELIAIDSWNNKQNAKRESDLKISGEERTKSLLAPYHATVIKKKSMDAVKDVPDQSLDFVFIDADHSYGAVRNDVREWTKKVREGGIVSGHDYYVFPNSGNRGVIDAVDEYVKDNEYELKIIDWDKENPVKDDQLPCWYFVK